MFCNTVTFYCTCIIKGCNFTTGYPNDEYVVEFAATTNVRPFPVKINTTENVSLVINADLLPPNVICGNPCKANFTVQNDECK